MNYIYDPLMMMNVPVRTKDASKAHEVVMLAEKILREMGKNNSTGKYDRVVQGTRSLLSQTLLSGEGLEKAVRSEVTRLLKKYNPNDEASVEETDECPEGMTCDAGVGKDQLIREAKGLLTQAKNITSSINKLYNNLDGLEKELRSHNDLSNEDVKSVQNAITEARNYINNNIRIV